MGVSQHGETVDNMLRECSKLLEDAGLELKIESEESKFRELVVFLNRENGAYEVIPEEKVSLELVPKELGTDFYINIKAEPAYLSDREGNNILRIYTKAPMEERELLEGGWKKTTFPRGGYD